MDWRLKWFYIFFILSQFSNEALAEKPEPTPSGAKEVGDGGKPGDGEDGKDQSATETSIEKSTSGGIREVMSFQDSNMDDALIVEVGDFSTISYSYFNDQFMNWHKPGLNPYNCYDDYIRCLVSQTIRHPVCAMHRINSNEGYKNLPSICDMQWYNCRRGHRFFFVMKYGVCAYQYRNYGSIYLLPQGRK